MHHMLYSSLLFFFNDTATTEIYTLSLHDALPILACAPVSTPTQTQTMTTSATPNSYNVPYCDSFDGGIRSEEHTSELQSLTNLVCRLLLEKKKNTAADSVTQSSGPMCISQTSRDS